MAINTILPLFQLPCELQKIAYCAVRAHCNAYCPYSNFAVGAALLHKDSKITTGCNYENCNFKGCCAEVCAIVKGNSEGRRTGKAIAIYGRSRRIENIDSSLSSLDDVVPPCGSCRQSLVEVADLSNNYNDFLVVLVTNDQKRAKVVKLCDLIPLKFGPSNIGLNVSSLAEEVEVSVDKGAEKQPEPTE